MSYPDKVILTEVGTRDGLQSVAETVSTEQKLQTINGLVDAGLKQIQVTSFVHPKWVPQMADAENVCAGLPLAEDVIYSGLVLNAKGVERAAEARLKRVEASISTSDTHSRKNANMGLDEALDHMKKMVALAHDAGLEVRGGLQSVWGCVYDGYPPDERIVDMVSKVIDMGVVALSLADSTGMANPNFIKQLLENVLPICKDTPVVLHLHDTRGLGLANAIAAMELGVDQFDTALGGLGGCPFIKGATGNIATEDTLNMLNEMGIESGVDIGRVANVSKALQRAVPESYFTGKLYKLVN
jgi:hydroxymethylglutaryl-CoA lyase|tara:strand:+ start:19640 stop:20536 length:897 start_codon:yes stop_codon:yes gene_type:complete